MTTSSIDINLLYFLDKKELVVHCPEFAIMGVATIPTQYTDIKEVITAAFYKKLNLRIQRFDGPSSFFDYLVSIGALQISNNKLIPLPLEQYIDALPYLQKTMEQPGASAFSLKYNLTNT